jgi:hypothetical protein
LFRLIFSQQTYEEMLAELEEAEGDAAVAIHLSCRWACTHKLSTQLPLAGCADLYVLSLH